MLELELMELDELLVYVSPRTESFVVVNKLSMILDDRMTIVCVYAVVFG